MISIDLHRRGKNVVHRSRENCRNRRHCTKVKRFCDRHEQRAILDLDGDELVLFHKLKGKTVEQFFVNLQHVNFDKRDAVIVRKRRKLCRVRGILFHEQIYLNCGTDDVRPRQRQQLADPQSRIETQQDAEHLRLILRQDGVLDLFF